MVLIVLFNCRTTYFPFELLICCFFQHLFWCSYNLFCKVCKMKKDLNSDLINANIKLIKPFKYYNAFVFLIFQNNFRPIFLEFHSQNKNIHILSRMFHINTTLRAVYTSSKSDIIARVIKIIDPDF